MVALKSAPSVDDLSFTDLFCGAGGTAQGAEMAGLRTRMAVNHWRLAVDTHATNFAHADHDCADISTCDPRRYPRTRILIASPECFPAGTLILTQDELIPIEQVTEFDYVLTHLGRWRRVTQVMRSVKDTIVVRGHGHYGLEVTGEHPFYTRGRKIHHKRDDRYGQFDYLEPGWTAARESVGRFWATPRSFGKALAIPPMAGTYRQWEVNEDFWWIVGRWLGDGSVAMREGKGGEVTVCCGNHEAEEVGKRLATMLGFNWRRRRVRTATLFELNHMGLATWLIDNFGKLAHGKKMPVWAFTMRPEWRGALLQGYVSADGAKRRENGVQCMTVSRELAFGVRLLASSLGYHVALHRYEQHNNVIEGRTVNTRPFYHLAWSWERKRNEGNEDDMHTWLPVKAVKPGREGVEVYNLSVEEDESYVADGIVVHNCTNHSLAKGVTRRKQNHDLWGDFNPDPSAERSRATMWDVPRFAEYHHYELIIVENVVDARNWVMWDAWILAMRSLDYEHQTVYLNSMHAHPTPQSRDRMYVVFRRKGLPAPDLEPHPIGWCVRCKSDVASVQSWKNPVKRWGRYRQQYVYRCPRCATQVEPYYYCAANAIDWAVPIERIGDRKHPLKPKTLARIESGLQKFAGAPFVGATSASLAGTHLRAMTDALLTQTSAKGLFGVFPPFVLAPGSWGQAQDVLRRPLPTEVTEATPMLVEPFLVDSGGVWESSATALEQPYPTQSTRRQPGLVVPFIVEVGHGGPENASRVKAITDPLPTQHTLGGAGVAYAPMVFPLSHVGDEGRVRYADEPMPTQTTRQELGLAMVPFVAELHGTSSTRSIDEALACVTAGGNHHALVSPPPFLVSYYGTDQGAHATTDALGTQSTRDRHALVSPIGELPAVDDCGFRVLRPSEIQAAMAFDADYVVLGTNRDKIKQLGNAVTPPAMRFLAERCMAVLEH